VNKRAVEALIKAGAFDALHADRASLLASVGLAFDWADTQAGQRRAGRAVRLRGRCHGSSTQEPALVPAEPWGMRERLQQEKTAIGFYLSGHLFDECDEVRRFCRARIADLVDSREPQVLAGIVTDLRVVNGRAARC
jgi:DNA polymerase-3 subunit alpha